MFFLRTEKGGCPFDILLISACSVRNSVHPAVVEHLMERESSGVLVNVRLTPRCLSDLLVSPRTGSTANCWPDLFSDTDAELLLFGGASGSGTIYGFVFKEDC